MPMSDEPSDEEKLAQILLREDRYKREAYRFVQESLEFTRRKLERKGHITGRELCFGFKDLARERFGLMAKTVLNQWGVTSSLDIGALVFNMVEEKIMVKQDSDQREDFENVFDFNEAFEKDFAIDMEP